MKNKISSTLSLASKKFTEYKNKFGTNGIDSDIFEGDYETIKSEESKYEGRTTLYPYRVYDELNNIYINKSSYGFIIEVTPLCGAEENTVKILTSMITDGVPEGTTIQILNWASPKVGEQLKMWSEERFKTGGIYRKLAEKRLDYFRDLQWKPVLKGSQYIIRDFRIVIAVSSKGEISEKGKEEMKALRVQLKTTLKGISVDSLDMEPESFLSFMGELVNPNFKQEREKASWNKYETLAANLVNPGTTLKVEPEHIEYEDDEGEVDITCFSVAKFPEAWAAWMSSDLIGSAMEDYLRIPCPFLTMFAFTFGDADKDKNMAVLKSTRSTQQVEQGIGKYISDAEQKAKDWKFVVGKIGEGQKLVKAHYEIVLYTKKENRAEAEQALKSLYSAKGWRIAKERYVQLQTWLSCLPFMHSEGLSADLKKFARTKTMLTWSCANLAPMQGEWKGMSKPYMMLFGRRGQPMFWNPFANKEGNYNVAVFGKSGGGKSVFMQELVASIRGAGGRVIIVDDGYSFRNSCVLQGGAFVEFAGKNPLCLNPFSILSKEAFEKDREYRADACELLKMVIGRMAKSVTRPDDMESTYIQEAVHKVFREKGTSASIRDVANAIGEIDDKRAKDLSRMLFPYVDGAYKEYFEGENNIPLDNPLIAFELSAIKSHKDLLSIVLMILMFLVTEKMYRGNRKINISLVIDESWSMLKGEGSGEFIEGIARRARKYEGNIISGTQSLNDYYKTEASKATIENTDWLCILPHKTESIAELKKTEKIMMDKGGVMEMAIKSLKKIDNEYGEVMIYGPNGWSIGRLLLDPYSLALYTSKGTEYEKIEAAVKRGMELEEAIEIVANDIRESKR
ncbi:MAG: type IV secretion system protein TraC [Proteobacteria bacterium]|nr:type IV secretion system protein TraC [Pseudomonadota bacterium]